jgi:hypothetical protein
MMAFTKGDTLRLIREAKAVYVETRTHWDECGEAQDVRCVRVSKKEAVRIVGTMNGNSRVHLSTFEGNLYI